MNLKAHFLRVMFGFLVSLFWACPEAHADHLVGGELYYECLGNHQYKITLVIYRDCFATGAPFDQNPVMSIYQGTTLYQNTSWIGFTSSTIPIENDDPCFVAPTGVCVQKAVYERILTLPPSLTGYTIVHQRCCRGYDIINLTNPQAQGNTYTIDIPPNDFDCNSSPIFNELPPVAICVNQPFEFDHSASEADGDELVYSLCSPLNGGTAMNPMPNPASAPPYLSVIYAPDFSADDPIIADPGFTIDPVTGFMQGTPTQLGQYVVGVCVEEYRDGVLLSTKRRDFQFNVVPCVPPITAIPAVSPANQETCSGLEFQFVNESTGADDFFWDFGVEGDDDAVSDLFAPQFTFPDTGVYEVMLVANPGQFCNDTTFLEVTAYHPVNVTITDVDFVCEDEQVWSFGWTGSASESAQFSWSFGNGSAPSTSADLFPEGISYSSPGFKSVTLNVVQGICEATATYNFEVAPPVIAGIAPQSEFCAGLTMNFTNQSSQATSYVWDFGDPGNPETASGFNAVHTFSESGNYEVTLEASAIGACPDTASEIFEVGELVEAFFSTPAIQCFEGHSFVFQSEGSHSEAAEITWDFGGEASIAQSFSSNPPPVIFPEPGSYPVTLTVTDNDCTSSHTALATVDPNPLSAFTAAVTSGCAPLEVAFQNQSQGSQGLTFNWYFGDGNTSAAAFPVHTYHEPGVYPVQLDVFSFSGCVGSDFSERVDYITVLPRPEAGFVFDPEELTIFDPEVSIANQSDSAAACTYLFPDGSTLEGCDLNYVFENAGTFEVIQTVTAENGCQATASGVIRVLGHLVYVPNAFSPNGDGVNDIFRPVMRGIQAYEMRILNRTSETLFHTTEPDEGWNGTFRGSYLVQPGVYVYQIRVQDMRGINHDYQGHVTVVR